MEKSFREKCFFHKHFFRLIENANISGKVREKMKLCRKKTKISLKIQNFFNQMQNFSEKFAKIHQKDSFLRTQDSFLKRDLSASPIDGLTQNINCCSCKTNGFHKNFPFREFSHFVFSQKKIAKFRFVFALFIFAKNAKFREKTCKMRPKMFAFFAKCFVRWKPCHFKLVVLDKILVSLNFRTNFKPLIVDFS